MINLEKTKIILASQSPRRSELMKQAGYEFEIIASNMEEVITKTEPEAVVEELSFQKADNVLNMILKSVDLSLMAFGGLSLMVIGADTIVCSNGNILGKP
jgi:septum formation protein